MSKHRLPEFIEYTGELCEYGCGQSAHYQFTNGIWCCSVRYHKCPSKRKIQSKAQKGRDDLIEQGKRLGSSRKFVRTIKYIKDKYPLFYKIEELRYKPNTKIIQVRCKNNNCKNSQEKNGWFNPTTRQLEKRIERLERQGLDGSYFYCSNKCKQSCFLFGKSTSQLINEFEIREDVFDKEYQLFRSIILERDDYKCQFCGEKGNIVHHEKPQKTHPHLTLDPDNGITCCIKCHNKYGHVKGTECSTGNLANRICIEL